MELVTMPQLGETVTEGTITVWHKQVGDEIAADDVLFEVSTEKVETEVPSAHHGFLRRVMVEEGETVPIGTPVAVITETADEPIDDTALISDPVTTTAAAPAPERDAKPAPRHTAPARERSRQHRPSALSSNTYL